MSVPLRLPMNSGQRQFRDPAARPGRPGGAAGRGDAHGVEAVAAKRRPRPSFVRRPIGARGTDRNDRARRTGHPRDDRTEPREAADERPGGAAVRRDGGIVGHLRFLLVVAADHDAVLRVAEGNRENPGARAVRALRCLTLKVPKPRISRCLPSARAVATVSRNMSTASAISFFVSPVLVAMSSTISALVIRISPKDPWDALQGSETRL